jgi:phosphoribosylformimino-5-aminoimidazole carboxamide ribotide isomerase
LNTIPVIDIRHGVVVRGVAGERDSYRPVQSRLTPSHAVVDVAEAIRAEFGLHELYVADLDAILDDSPHVELYRELAGRGFHLTVDAGLRDLQRAATLFAAGVQSVVAGLETIPGPQLLRELTGEFGPDRVLFSLDLKNGRPLFAPVGGRGWSEAMPRLGTAPTGASSASLRPAPATPPLDIAAAAYDAGIRCLIVLDLAAVGTGNGLSTLPLCREIQNRFPDVHVITGGGVRDREDLRELNRSGLHAVLIATALHNGSITRDDLP